MTVTIEETHDVDLDKEIPCELLYNERRCGRPAVARAKATCVLHGWGTVWVCARCRKIIHTMWLTHGGCYLSMEVEWL